MRRLSFFQISTLFLVLYFTSCNIMWGDHALGNNLSLLEGDKKEDRVIVYCTSKNMGACKSGIYVVPTYHRHYENGNYAEYVDEAKANKNWVIAKSIRIKDKKESYWIIDKRFNIKILDCQIINCDSILQNRVTGPLNSIEFRARKKELNVNLDF